MHSIVVSNDLYLKISILADIQLSFNNSQYEVNETTGSHEQLITIVKEDDIKTEQVLQVLVQLSPLSGDGIAGNGKQRISLNEILHQGTCQFLTARRFIDMM